MDYFSTDFKLGILGGGQLGKMLLYHTRQWDVATRVLDPSPDAPARLGANQFSCGDLQDYDTVYNFGKEADVITVEIEHVNIEALQQLEREGKTVHPSPAALRIIQDKGLQKEFYRERNIPTASFKLYDSPRKADLAPLKYPWVWKARKGGYDGKGVRLIRSEKDLGDLPDMPFMLEEMVPFRKELGVVVARNASGEVRSFEAVEMEFHPTANLVEYVLCPVRESESIRRSARELAERTVKEFDICGLLAVELFLTDDDRLLVNEVAPRPHNSGHLTIETAHTSQFEQHLRAILNLPLGDPAQHSPGVMINLLGAEGETGDVQYKNYEKALATEGTKLHIYGKRQTRPFRKMGHATVVDSDLDSARKRAEEVKNSISVIAKNKSHEQ